MTAEEAIKHLELIIDNEAYSDYFQDVCRTAREALEKQVAKKPKIDEGLLGYDYCCPNCGAYIGNYHKKQKAYGFQRDVCCCGQKIDWAE